VHGMLLREANVVVDMWASRQLRNFNVRPMHGFVPDTTNAGLTAFYSSELFHKRFAICATISGLGRTVFEFTLEKSVSQVWS
jgi:hypothetical protein